MGINAYYLVQEKEMFDTGIDVRFSYKLANGEALSNWIRYFTQLKTKYNDIILSQDEILVDLVDYTDNYSFDGEYVFSAFLGLKPSNILTPSSTLTPGTTLVNNHVYD